MPGQSTSNPDFESPHPQHHDSITWSQMAAYSAGMLVNNLQAASIPAMMVVLNLGLGLNPILVGFIGFLPRIFDAVSDPMMGHISDTTRTRWGRRRPFIFIGAIVAGLVFAGMWQVPTGRLTGGSFDADGDGIPDQMEISLKFDANDINSPVPDGNRDLIDETGPEDGISDALEFALIKSGIESPITSESNLDLDGDDIPDYDYRRQNFYFLAFLAALILYFLTYTVYATPFVALGYEMTPDYHERTRLHAVANSVGQLVWIGTPWIWAIMAAYESKVEGASELGLLFGAIMIVMGIVPAIFCRERMPAAISQQETQGVLSNLKDFFVNLFTTLMCTPFLRLCSATFLVFNGYQLGISFSLYVMIYYLFSGNDTSAGALNGTWGSLTALCTILVIPLTAYISERVGKRRTFMITISLSIVGYALKWIGYNPDHPNLLLLSCPFVAFGTGSLFTLMGSMISDVCDYDELTSHQRREGVFAAVYWWMVKVGLAVAGLMTGWLLVTAGFQTPPPGATDPVVQSEATMLYLRLFDVIIPIATSVLAMLIMWNYEISEERANEIRDELDQRKQCQSESNRQLMADSGETQESSA